MKLPERWEAAPARDKFWDGLKSSRRWLLLLDYDGTLAPFHVDRMQATPYPGVVERLDPIFSLPNGRVEVICGGKV